jgi:hypothetical protein
MTKASRSSGTENRSIHRLLSQSRKYHRARFRIHCALVRIGFTFGVRALRKFRDGFAMGIAILVAEMTRRLQLPQRSQNLRGKQDLSDLHYSLIRVVSRRLESRSAMRTAISLSVIRITVTPVPVDGPLPGVQLNISDRTRAQLLKTRGCLLPRRIELGSPPSRTTLQQVPVM